MSAMLLDVAPVSGGLTPVVIVVLLVFAIGLLAVVGVVVFLLIRRNRLARMQGDSRD